MLRFHFIKPWTVAQLLTSGKSAKSQGYNPGCLKRMINCRYVNGLLQGSIADEYGRE
jgi:hypothetical protein